MTDADIKDACDMLWKRYQNYKEVADAIGVKIDFVKRYLKYEALPPLLKQAIKDGSLGDPSTKKPVDVAIKAVDGLDYFESGVDEQKVLDFALILANKKSAQERGDLYKEAKKNPVRSIEEIEKKAKIPHTRKTLRIIIENEDYDRLEKYKDNQNTDSIEESANKLIVDGLERAKF